MNKALEYRETPALPAVASRGEGVLETLRVILEQTMDNLMARYPRLSLFSGETVESWTWQMLHNVFGVSSIATEAPPATPEPPREDQRVVRVSVPRVTVGAGKTQSPGELADTYAQASMELSSALERTREERDEARRRLEELEHTLRAIEAEEQGRSPEDSLGEALERVVVGGGCRAATLLAAGPERSFNYVTGLGLTWEPLLKLSDGQEVVQKRFLNLQEPLLLEVESDADLARAVEPLHPPAKAMVAVPIRSTLGLHGLVMLYYGATDPLPSSAVLTHLHNMGRVLAAWFSVKRAAAVGTTVAAVRRTLPQIESAARSALELVREARRNPQIAEPSLDKVARTLDGVVTLTSDLAGPQGRAKRPSGGR